MPVTLAPGIAVNPLALPVITPVAFNVPDTFTPVPVTTAMLALPAALYLLLR